VLAMSNDWRLVLLNNWSTIVGSLKTRICLEKIFDDMLVIGVYEYHWMQELHMLSRVIIATINKHLDKPRIVKLQFRLKEEKPKHFLPRPAPSVYVSRAVTFTEKQQQALINIADEGLRQALTNFFIRCQVCH
jgi:Dna[CI] antecedent, DciA